MRFHLQDNRLPLFTAGGILAVLMAIALVFSYGKNASLPNIALFEKNITLTESSISSEYLAPEDTAVFTASFTSPSGVPQLALIDIELINSEKKRVAQYYWDNVRLVKGKTVTYEVSTPPNLPPGEYFFWIGVFKPKWESIVNSYNAQSFEVRVSGTNNLSRLTLTFN
jgi:hypothetical protein